MKKKLKKEKKIKFLLDLSMTAGQLDPRKIAFIAKMLKRREFKAYLSLLEKKVRKEKVTVITAISIPKTFMVSVKKLFSGKEILFKRDYRILAGMQVLFADYIFDASFRHYLENVKRYYYEID